MAIDYAVLKDWRIPDKVTPYGRQDCMLYALGLGYASNPLHETEQPFVYEEWLKPAPTLLAVLGAPGAWARDLGTGTGTGTGIAWLQILHGEHCMTFHAPLAPEGTLRSRTRVVRIGDKGAGRGALVVTIEHTSFCRADCGIGRSDETPVALPAVPETSPDTVVDLATEPRAAVWYRRNGDRNPLYVDPASARKASHARPILYGLCSYGMAARAILRACCDNDSAALKSLALRFSAPMFPGEALRIELWRREGLVQFCGIAAERGIPALTHGVADLHA